MYLLSILYGFYNDGNVRMAVTDEEVDADLILVMQNGTIIEQGNHKRLLESGGAYAELYNSQFA